jgi:sugar/nucleoside kinase (ribokinase family)
MVTETPKYVFVGKLKRDYFITADDRPVLDTLGGNLAYAAVGLKLWEQSPPPGLMARVGEDYPQAWIDDLERRGFDTRGINILPEAVDVRNFYVYTDKATRITGDPVPHFSRLGEPFPKALLGYRDTSNALDSKTNMSPTSLRQGDIPDAYMDATAAHLCPVDYLTHSLLPATFRQAGFTTVTLDPAPGYMNPTFFNDVPSIVTGLTAFIPAEDELRLLFQGRTDDLWEMAEALGAYGCDFIIIKRGERGQLVYDSAAKSRWEIPAYAARLTNPTGVGDAFCGGFLAGYRKAYDPVEAALYGNIAAAIVAEGVGPFFALDVLPGLPEARLEAQRQAVRKL